MNTNYDAFLLYTLPKQGHFLSREFSTCHLELIIINKVYFY